MGNILINQLYAENYLKIVHFSYVFFGSIQIQNTETVYVLKFAVIGVSLFTKKYKKLYHVISVSLCRI